jgi:hypothetical protein
MRQADYGAFVMIGWGEKSIANPCQYTLKLFARTETLRLSNLRSLICARVMVGEQFDRFH